MTRTSMLVLTIVLTSGIGCGRTSPAPRPATPPPQTTPPSEVARAEPEAAPAIPEADIRALLGAWTESQNRGDFQAYSALYAERFQGVRRNSDRTRSFDRAGWMKDRERMFRRPIVVAASDVVVNSTQRTADVRFTQRWSSGSYADEGPKRLVLVREGTALKISVEEMLAAQRLDDVDAALTLGTFVSLPTVDGPIAILAEAPASAATGAPRLVTREDPYVVTKAASETIPASVRALVGRTVTVIERGRACEGRIDAIVVASLVVPHFGTVAEWNGEGESGATTPLTPAARAASAWSLATTHFYAATMRSTCTQPVAMTFAATPGVTVFTPREPRTDERPSLERAFERTRRFLDREAAYATYVSELGEEAGDDAPAPPTQRGVWRRNASVVVFESGPRRVATVVHNAQGCGQFDVSAWAGFELGATPVELLEPTAIGDYVSVMAVFDVDGDGALEAIVRRDLASYGLVRLTPTTSLLRRVNVDYLDCPC